MKGFALTLVWIVFGTLSVSAQTPPWLYKFEAFGDVVSNVDNFTPPGSYVPSKVCPGFDNTYANTSPLMFTGYIQLFGGFQGNVLDTGTYQICTWNNASYPNNGYSYLIFTSSSDGSKLRLGLTIPTSQASGEASTWAGSFVLEPSQSTGRFASQAVYGSGTFQLNPVMSNPSVFPPIPASNSRGTLVLNGVLTIPAS